MDGETTSHNTAKSNLPTTNDEDEEEDENGVLILGHVRDFTKMVSLKIQDKTFYIHGHVLEGNPGYLGEMMTSGRDKSKPITLDDVHPDILR
ncbi:hypothetical protein VMCG_01564 [Cytospora schulzeri]|uniref:BTB domain-containing protein n=1 Tax=Cytospora schulzeri TaxID=448051 RepID=A0A423X5R4_9PEZI|nr:hypothetical protein VMCG_01564 [Valsa malicola]